MPFKEYTLPDGTKMRHGKAFKIDGEASFPANWLELSTVADRNRYGITVRTLPDPVRPPLSLMPCPSASISLQPISVPSLIQVVSLL